MFTADPSMLLGVNDNRRGTPGQLVGGLVEVQVVCLCGNNRASWHVERSALSRFRKGSRR